MNRMVLITSDALLFQEVEALDALRILSKALTASKLRMLNISDNALGEKGVRACAEAFTSQVRWFGPQC